MTLAYGEAEWWIPVAYKALKSAGFSPPSAPEWTPTWKAEFKKFQKAKGLTADGIPGPNTWRQLQPTMPVLDEGWARRILIAAMHHRDSINIMAVTCIATDQKPEAGKKLLAVLAEWHDWLDKKGARKTLWKDAGGDPDKVEGEVGVLPAIVIAGPLMISEGAAAIAAGQVVATVGAAAAAAGAAWLAAKTIAILTKYDWDDIEISAEGTAVTAPPAATPIPPTPPRNEFSFRQSLKYWRGTILAGCGIMLAILTQGWGVVASLLPLAAAAATAAGGGAALLLLLLLAFLAAFGREFKRGR